LQGTSYFTVFRMNSTELQRRRRIDHVLIAPLSSETQNCRICCCSSTILRFFYQNILFEAEITKTEENHNERAVKLGLPSKIRFFRQRRSHFRTPVHENYGVVLSATRPSGISFSGIIKDISISGVHFVTQHTISRIVENARLEIRIYWPKKSTEIMVEGKLIKLDHKSKSIRVKFEHSDSIGVDDVSQLVHLIQRENIKRQIK